MKAYERIQPVGEEAALIRTQLLISSVGAMMGDRKANRAANKLLKMLVD